MTAVAVLAVTAGEVSNTVTVILGISSLIVPTAMGLRSNHLAKHGNKLAAQSLAYQKSSAGHETSATPTKGTKGSSEAGSSSAPHPPSSLDQVPAITMRIKTTAEQGPTPPTRRAGTRFGVDQQEDANGYQAGESEVTALRPDVKEQHPKPPDPKQQTVKDSADRPTTSAEQTPATGQVASTQDEEAEHLTEERPGPRGG